MRVLSPMQSIWPNTPLASLLLAQGLMGNEDPKEAPSLATPKGGGGEAALPSATDDAPGAPAGLYVHRGAALYKVCLQTI